MAALYQARRQALPLADDCADAVLCHVALMLTDDAPQVLAEARRVLKTGGLFSAVVVGGGAARLGDRRLHSPEGIAELFAAHFEPPAIDEVVLHGAAGRPDSGRGSATSTTWDG